MSEKYNGWTNYETWRIHLEIADDEIQALGQGEANFASELDLIEHLKEHVDDVLTKFGELTDGLALDYARAFVSDVDWYDIAQHAIQDNPALIAGEEDSA